ncbi:galactosyltransferase-related protein [Pseudomonas sp. NPDC089408]|uniref:galactosyltransferase-related protein n=1 Tax=Pseudomonas sp. NPDC089408 TaxID=3364465 RepID=UPI0038127796
MTGEPITLENLASLTAIVPLDLQFRAKDIVAKAKAMAVAAEKHSLNIIFSHNDRGTRFDSELKKHFSAQKHSTLVSGKFYEDAVNSALLRNIAFSKVTTDYLVLLDVDLWLDTDLLKKYFAPVKFGLKAFTILPCLYLSQSGSKALISGKKTAQTLCEDYFSFSRKEFLHLANPSSVIIMLCEDYKSLTGFNTDFIGHGYEDFDFMIRLASKHAQIKTSPDFFDHTTARSPLFAQGFRRELGRLCLSPLIEKDFFLHIFHKKTPESENYYSLRKRNYMLFCKLHQSMTCGSTPKDQTLITEFVETCISLGKSINDYSIYFENKPGHIDRYDTFKRRLKFLMQ